MPRKRLSASLSTIADMTDRTAAARNARLRERKRAAGIIPLTVMVPADRAEDLKALAAQWRQDAQSADDPFPRPDAV